MGEEIRTMETEQRKADLKKIKSFMVGEVDKNVQIINSILDTDLYKLTMLQAFWHQYPKATGRWEFKCRNKGIKLGFLANQIREQLDMMKGLHLSLEELWEIESACPYLSKDFLIWLSHDFRLDPSLVSVTDVDGHLEIIAEGKLIEVNIFEVFILSIVNELYFEHEVEKSGKTYEEVYAEGLKRLEKKVKMLKGYPRLLFAEFGTRRRFSKLWQEKEIAYLAKHCPNMVGCSNIKIALANEIKPIGTVAHEWSMAHLGFVDRVEQAQGRALHVWRQEYGQDLGIALSDTFTTDAFLRDFDFSVARAYAGVRHDSGCPFIFGHKMIKHYEDVGIDPRRKSIIFSDGLDVEKAIAIWKEFAGLISISFGIGTNFSNDLGFTPLQIVMKLLMCNGEHTVKLSDDEGKNMGNEGKIEEVIEAYVK